MKFQAFFYHRNDDLRDPDEFSKNYVAFNKRSPRSVGGPSHGSGRRNSLPNSGIIQADVGICSARLLDPAEVRRDRPATEPCLAQALRADRFGNGRRDSSNGGIPTATTNRTAPAIWLWPIPMPRLRQAPTRPK